jgi:hypothetical protein
MTFDPVFAHAGHWLELAFFLPPAVLVLSAMVRSWRAERARRHPTSSGKESP